MSWFLLRFQNPFSVHSTQQKHHNKHKKWERELKEKKHVKVTYIPELP